MISRMMDLEMSPSISATNSRARESVLAMDQILENLYSTDARLRPSPEEMRTESERWLGPSRSADEAYPWDHTATMRNRLTYYDHHRGRDLRPQDLDPWLKHIADMMFSNGDYWEPLFECKLFMLETIWEQMNHLLKRCWERAVEQKRTVITHEDVIYQMRNNFERIGRLIGHAILEQRNTNVLHHNHLYQRLVVDPGQEMLTILEEYYPDVYPATKYFREHCSQLYEAVVLVNEEMLMMCGDNSYQLCIKPHMKRISKLAKRDELLDMTEKTMLEAARKTTFTSRTGRRSAFFAERFHCFLGRPPLETDLIYVLDYLAQEIVAEICGAACILRDDEIESYAFEDVWYGESEDCIQIHHYERAFHEHPGVMKAHDLLFGDDVDMHMTSAERSARRQQQKEQWIQQEAEGAEREMDELSIRATNSTKQKRKRNNRARSVGSIGHVPHTVRVPLNAYQEVWKKMSLKNTKGCESE